MAGAGLTRGSFYSYFKNKTDLTIKALKWSIHKSHLMVKSAISQSSTSVEHDELQIFLNHYLSPQHRDAIADGCPVAALSRDFAKETLAARKEFATILNETIEERRSLLKCNGLELTRDEWMGVMCTYVGSIIISRACRGTDLSDEVLLNAKGFLNKLN
jgi:TetR/AcrR family transcriptional repressor of nem operon